MSISDIDILDIMCRRFPLTHELITRADTATLTVS